ncbi:MAG: hypothetical protein ACXW2I_14935, partial [Burkholderiales bacterium]
MICALAGAAAAKLPAPSPEQQQAAAANKEQEQAPLAVLSRATPARITGALGTDYRDFPPARPA